MILLSSMIIMMVFLSSMIIMMILLSTIVIINDHNHDLLQLSVIQGFVSNVVYFIMYVDH